MKKMASSLPGTWERKHWGMFRVICILFLLAVSVLILHEGFMLSLAYPGILAWWVGPEVWLALKNPIAPAISAMTLGVISIYIRRYKKLIKPILYKTIIVLFLILLLSFIFLLYPRMGDYHVFDGKFDSKYPLIATGYWIEYWDLSLAETWCVALLTALTGVISWMLCFRPAWVTPPHPGDKTS